MCKRFRVKRKDNVTMKTNKFITVSSAVLLSAGMLGAISAVNENNSVQTVQAAKKHTKRYKKFSISKFRKRVMKATGISKKQFNIYTVKGYWHKGNIINAIKHPSRYAYKKDGSWWAKDNAKLDEYIVASSVLSYKKSRTKKTAVKPNTGTGTSSSSPSSTVKPRINKPSDRSNNSTKSSSAESFKQKVMKATGITEKQFNYYTNDGFYKNGNIVDAIKNPNKYIKDSGKGYYLKTSDNVTDDEYAVASYVLDTQKNPDYIPYSTDDKITIDDNWRKSAAQYFIKYVNNWRKEQGLSELTTGNALLQKAADIRATELLVRTGHTRPDGRQWYTVDADVGLPDANKWIDDYSKPYTDEACGYESGSGPITATDFARSIFNVMVYDDAASNWGHRDSLKSTRATQVAVGVAYKKAGNSEYNLTLEVKLIS